MEDDSLLARTHVEFVLVDAPHFADVADPVLQQPVVLCCWGMCVFVNGWVSGRVFAAVWAYLRMSGLLIMIQRRVNISMV
jgi:hypothetical protein